MSELSLVISIMAVLAALAGVWLISDSVSKIKAHTESLVETHIKTFQAKITETNSKLQSMTNKVGAIEAMALSQKQEVLNQISEIEKNLQHMSGELKDLSQAMPHDPRRPATMRPQRPPHST